MDGRIVDIEDRANAVVAFVFDECELDAVVVSVDVSLGIIACVIRERSIVRRSLRYLRSR